MAGFCQNYITFTVILISFIELWDCLLLFCILFIVINNINTSYFILIRIFQRYCSQSKIRHWTRESGKSILLRNKVVA